MSEPTDKQIKEFWEKCGFTLEELHSLKSDEPYFVTHDPSGKQWEYWIGHKWDNKIPVRELYPPIDLNNLFKYAVPELLGELKYYCQVNKLLADWVFSIVWDDKDPALALFWALWQVKEKSNESKT